MEYKKEDLTTISRLAKHADVSPDAVKKWGLQPVKKVGRINYYYQGDVYKKLRSMSAGGQATEEKKSFDHERTRKEKESADKLEMENELTRGNQVLVSDVEANWLEMVALFKAKMLGIKTRIPRIITKLSSVTIPFEEMKNIENSVDKEVKDALSELSRSAS